MTDCILCGEPLSEFEECTYGDLCMFCYDRLEDEAAMEEYDDDEELA